MAKKKKINQIPFHVPSLSGFIAYCKDRKIDMGFGFQKKRGEHYSRYIASLPKKI